MQWSLGYYHHYICLQLSNIIYNIYILDIFCLVSHVPTTKDYLITNCGGSTMKNKFVATCQAIALKSEKTRNISQFSTLFYFSILRVSLDLGANSTIDRALSALRVHCIRFSKLFNLHP